MISESAIPTVVDRLNRIPGQGERVKAAGLLVRRLPIVAILWIAFVAPARPRTSPKALRVEAATMRLPASRSDTAGTGWTPLAGVEEYRDVSVTNSPVIEEAVDVRMNDSSGCWMGPMRDCSLRTRWLALGRR